MMERMKSSGIAVLMMMVVHDVDIIIGGFFWRNIFYDDDA